MTKNIATKPVDKAMFVNYLKKAVECLGASEKALKDGAYNSTGINAVHAAISAADAYCVSGLAKRCSSSKHEDAAELIKTTPYPDAEKSAISKLFMSVIRIKNMAEYEERLVKQKEAEKAARDAGELLAMVKKRLL